MIRTFDNEEQDNSSSDSFNAPEKCEASVLLEGANELKYRAGGHSGTLVDDEGLLIFKPACEREHRFYTETLKRALTIVPAEGITDSVHLSRWMPAFLGVLSSGKQTGEPSGDAIQLQVPEKQSLHNNNDQDALQTQYLVLENLLKGYHKPQVMDIKLGKLLYDDQVSPSKRKRLDEVSAKTTSGTLSFRICGMIKSKSQQLLDTLDVSYYDEIDAHSILINKVFGKSRDENTVVSAIKLYLQENDLSSTRQAALKEMFCQRLQLLYNSLLDSEVRLISCSLLFIYEGDSTRWDSMSDEDSVLREEFAAADRESDDSESEEILVPLSSLSLIDFAHSQWTPGAGYDENTIQGVENLIKVLESI